MTSKHKPTLIERANEGLTVARVAGGVIAIGSLLGTWFLVEGHFQTRADAMGHSQKDEQRGAWTSYGLRNNRLEYLADKQAECDQRKLLGTLAAIDAALCARFEAQAGSVGKEVAELKSKAVDAGKEKQ